MNKTRPNLHFQKENTYTFHIWIALMPLVCYGFYKNGILPFLYHDANFIQMFRPLLFAITGVLVGCAVDYFIWWNSEKEQIWTNAPLYGLITAMTMPYNANLILFAILLALILFLTRKIKWKISPLYLSVGLLAIIFSILGHVSYANPSEASHTFIYSTMDIFFGRSIGGILTTSIFWTLLSFLYLWFNPYYKKEIPLYIIGVYAILTFLFEMILPTGDLLKSLLNSSVFFGSVFIASEMYYSPYTEKGKIVYSILIGIIGFFLTRFMEAKVGMLLAITILSLIVPFLDELAVKWHEKKKNFCRTSKIKFSKQKKTTE